ncbi:hypothetical protein NFX39_04790 [Fructobacillus sp. W13]|uniref:Uncharacterized protein n=1 Tax=Fructobacillus apis TaxID=2935017 RepID=A0ABT0ZR17_9LACO|nr:hypothetical protein [Fructobacillus apis]MCO0832395.1 hypothetical protein [Fructobacillus apis]
MKIKDIKLRRKDYWVSVEPIETPEEALKENEGSNSEYPNQVMDYRVLSFTFEDYLIIEWAKAFPGPNPLDILPSRMQEDDVTGLDMSHGIISFETKGAKDDRDYRVTINTVRS